MDKYFELLSEHLNSQARLIAEQFKSHPGENGRNKEVILSNALSSIFPDRYSLGTGFIVSSDSISSGQNDIIIHVEAAYGVIEVKSYLGTRELDAAIESARTIKIMPQRGTRNDIVSNPGLRFLTNSVFAYDGMQLPALRAHLENRYKGMLLDERLDFVVILNRGIFYMGSCYDIVRYGQQGSPYRLGLGKEQIARLKDENPSEIGGMELNQYTFYVWCLWMLSHLSYSANKVSGWLDYLPVAREWGCPI